MDTPIQLRGSMPLLQERKTLHYFMTYLPVFICSEMGAATS